MKYLLLRTLLLFSSLPTRRILNIAFGFDFSIHTKLLNKYAQSYMLG